MRRIGPGRIRRKLAKMIVETLSAPGFHVRTDPEKLRPNMGYWRTNHQADCMPWEGSFDVQFSEKSDQWVTCSIASWATMTDLLKGFTFERRGLTVELFADHEKQRSLPTRVNPPKTA